MRHLFNGKCIATVTELCNILAFCKSLASNSVTDAHVNYIDMACALLQRFIDEEMESNLPDVSTYPLIKFIIEQLHLCQLSKYVRNYSPTLITMAFLWQMTSTSLYKRLKSVLILPSISRLRQLSRGSSVDTCSVDVVYLT